MISELDSYNTMALRVEQGDKILIGRDDIKLKIRGFDSKSNIRSKNVIITCNNK